MTDPGARPPAGGDPGAERAPAVPPVITFVAHFLFVLAAWTLVIKYLLPLAFAVAEGVPLATHVMWDFWWVVHLWLGWALLRGASYAGALGMVVSVAEIVIVVTKLARFLPDPEWTMWTSHWFVNKLFVLACFCLLLGALVRRRGSPYAGAPMDARSTARG